ncbi:DUF6477 family protein [Oceaniglobus trochenteri]|uniref:DUF6477 family protein n=1 Tax=Oceaniglobus trochenteri TaxID=2763260 RepID=UPI001D000212|nr:DUF6477 family protein [Oceaniglobus trochenteri]
MTQPSHLPLSALRRPRLLIRAARFGLADYNRTRTLSRILPDTGPDADPLPPLLSREADCEARRRQGDATYSVARHVEILIALMSEANRTAGAQPGA